MNPSLLGHWNLFNFIKSFGDVPIMFTTISIYFLMLLLIFWSYCGYVILLFAFSVLGTKRKNDVAVCEELSKVAVIVPCYNEEAYVEQKIVNLKGLEYETEKLEVYFLDGKSTDNTCKEITRYISDMPNWHLIETGCRGKINQINNGLSKISNDVSIIVNTDMDAILSPDTLIKFIHEFNSDSRVAVVGAFIMPQGAIHIEENSWEDQNLFRLIESNVYTSSIVVAPCYSYRASFIERFPEDCIADDIYIAFKANTEGYLTKYIESAKGSEIRTPKTFQDFFKHKFRKGNAYLVELFRYFYRLPYMPGWWKMIFLTKLLQFAIIPWVLPYFILSTISLALSGWGLFQVALFGLIFLFISLVTTSFIMKKGRDRFLNYRKSKRFFNLHYFAVANLILVLVGLSYPFYKQTSSYEKIERKK